MPLPVSIDRFLADHVPLIDVRSPGEFLRGHIPGASSVPLFTDQERAIIGTLYTHSGRDAAMLEGLRIVGPKMADIVEHARELAPHGKIGVHCWRGGERSASVAWLLEKAGFTEILVLKRGYKAFRDLVLSSFSVPRKLEVLGGFTGTGKTQLLGLLQQEGEQIMDLEDLAHHKGSAYGGIGEKEQPTTEQFENLIWNALFRLDHERPIWVEDESQSIGHVKIPDPFFAQMRSGTVHFIDMPVEQRAARLVHDYGAFPKEELAEATQKIQKRLGPQNAKEALEALEAGDLHRVAMITLTYYDRSYARGLAARDPKKTRILCAGELSHKDLTRKILEHVRRKNH